ncbi:type II toxin-antitoxin system RelE/ParE family toxin [Flavobacterium hauense]
MGNGYNVFWTDHALSELKKTIEYLEEHWTESDLRNFASKLENTLQLISVNPDIFPNSDTKNIKRAIVAKHNTLYYRVNNNSIEIISLFSHRQNPRKRKL